MTAVNVNIDVHHSYSGLHNCSSLLLLLYVCLFVLPALSVEYTLWELLSVDSGPITFSCQEPEKKDSCSFDSCQIFFIYPNMPFLYKEYVINWP